MTGTDVFRWSRPLAWGLLAVAFFCRLGFGLASNFWTADERQVYLIGLQAFARHVWPYYGADVVWTESRLPGALQGLLISGPLTVVPVPESPFILLNLLTCGALAGFASYLTRRVPQLPRWIIWVWLMTAPWTLHFGTHVVNTSYQLPASIAFFIGFFEATPALSAGLIGPFGAWALMGLGVTWMMQMHLSWVLLPAYMLIAFVSARRRPTPATMRAVVGGVLAGAVVPAILLAPTLVRGLAGTGGVERNVDLHAHGVGALVMILAQFLSFASTEINRFIGLDTAQRLMLLATHVWLIPLAAVLLVTAIVQPVLLVVTAIRARQPPPEWPAVRTLAAGTVLWVYASYALSVRGPQAHAFYTVFPVATLFAMYAWSFYAGRRWFRVTAAGVLTVNVLFHAGFALAEWRERSLYRDRPLVAHAILQHNDRLIGERRTGFSIETPGSPGPPGFDTAVAVDDLKVTRVAWSRAVLGRVSTFDVTIQNDGRAAAYIDLQYRVTYFDGAQRAVGQSEGVIKEIVQPGRARRWPQLVDGLALPAAVSATFDIVGAERVIPDS